MSAPSTLLRSARHNVRKPLSTASSSPLTQKYLVAPSSRCLATATPTPRSLPDVSFTASFPHYTPPPLGSNNNPNQPPSERTLKLGKALRILQSQLPTLLQSPLPQEILSPQITLHLFPSTHPHLPTVTGRVAYSAALYTSPIAWGRLPLIGNVRLKILSERVVKNCGAEQLIVRWSTLAGKDKDRNKISEWFGKGQGEFTGLFIFEFDTEGRVVSHTIENVQAGGDWERGVGARMVGLTDWLLGGMRNGNGKGQEGSPCPAFWNEEGRR